ncbi:glutathione S-transferase [Roseomonas gilardii subsp. gilardii]|uniref:glutathione S-transferase family protein n=1 Tax=Roseomonas gilardii TaxID=257708 RepID=UPI001FF9E9F7|nr:glutathione S-transferase [Roseomonas gilardii]UPG73723.1 glutathione S-transferase [Roseomonas gilardii subsp. gilardii]
MLTIHHLNNSRSQRVLWLLEELGVPYEVKRYERDPQTILAPPELRAVHPLGKSPVLTEDGMVLAETGAIVEYILDRHGGGRLQPAKDGPHWWPCRHWMHHAEGSAMPPLVMTLQLNRAAERVPPEAGAALAKIRDGFVAPGLERMKQYWNDALAETGWFAGPQMTVADIMMSFPIEAATHRAPFGEAQPNPARFLERIHARPAYRRALERGGPYAYA